MVNIAWSERSKTLIDEPKYRDPNVGVYTDIEGVVIETFTLYWAHIYPIFDNNDLSEVENDVQSFHKIAKSQIHAIIAHPCIMHYTDGVY